MNLDLLNAILGTGFTTIGGLLVFLITKITGLIKKEVEINHNNLSKIEINTLSIEQLTKKQTELELEIKAVKELLAIKHGQENIIK